MIKMIFPDKFVAALGKHTYPIQIERDASGLALSGGSRCRADRLPCGRGGWQAANPNRRPCSVRLGRRRPSWRDLDTSRATAARWRTLCRAARPIHFSMGESSRRVELTVVSKFVALSIESLAPSQVSSTVLRKSNPTPREVASPLARSPREQLANRCARPTPILGKHRQADSQR